MQGTEYDAAGRATLRTLGSTNPVQTRYNYYPWNASVNGGKLQQIYTTRGAAVLQNFQYDYDSNSNIASILDYVMGNPQTQQFSYDNLDRLTSAGAADGTEGNYGPEGYSYDSATGNLAVKGSSSYNYGAQSAGCPDGALDKAHAAVAAGGNSYCNDPNGNMVRRTIGGVAYTLTYDAENHMLGYSGGTVSASFLYDGDGRRVQATVNGATTQFVGSHVEWQSSTSDMVRYYFAGGARVAMRTGDADLVWLVGDHLGSTSIAVADASGVIERQGYKAFGETRFGSLPTKYQYTGQRNEPELGLYYYGARWYDSSLSRFAQADTIVPDPYNSLDYDRYQYVRSNPIRFSDPSGNKPCDDWDDEGNCISTELFWQKQPEPPLSWGGEQVYKIYMLLKNTKGWWNADGNFTLEEFVGLWILTEANWGAPGFPFEIAAELIAKAVAQGLFIGGFREATCQSAACFNGVFEFIFQQSRMADSLFTGPDGKPFTADTIAAYAGPSSMGLTNPNEIMAAAQEYGNAALHPTSLNPDRKNAPSNWGNDPNRGLALKADNVPEGKVLGPNDSVIFYWGGFFIYTTNQSGRHFKPLMK